MTSTPPPAGANPFFEPWDGSGLPPFERIGPEDFRPAFDRAIAEHRAEIDAIAGSVEATTFENTVAALERSGRPLRRVSATFFNLAGADSTDALQAIEREVSPQLARHRSATLLNGPLFARVAHLFARREGLGLTPEQARLLERYHTLFVRAGAGLEAGPKARLAEISERLALLGTRFSQNVLEDERSYVLPLEGEEDLAGLPAEWRGSAARVAEERGLPGQHVVALSRSSIEPFLELSARRDLREKAFRAWLSRGENGGETDNRAIIAEIVRLRAERASLLGYDTFAEFKLADTMARTPEAARRLLQDVWEPGRARALAEGEALQALVQEEGHNFAIGPHDWRHYAEKQRRRLHDLDEAEIKPYLPLDRMIEAAFDTAEHLFGLKFREIEDAPRYHPDVRVFEVADAEDRVVGLFLGDYFARPSKRSGAWMSAFRTQEKLDGEVTPVIVNVMNFAKGGEGEPALLSFDDARTLFHEFGHALHGLLSQVTYPLLSGTAVAGDFVELPSQLFEHWLEQPEVLGRFARHYRTGEPMPKALLDKILGARTFDQGFATVEYTASALVDLDLHLLPESARPDVVAFEREELARIGMPEAIAMRHRTPHFSHIFSGDGYAAGYYSYLWSEVLDADAFEAFREAGDIYDPATARRLREFIYGAGNLRDPSDAYRAFRGRLPSIEPLLKKRGLTASAAGA